MPINHNLSDTVQHYLSQRYVIPIVGPSAVGKTSLMQKVIDIDNQFAIASGFTTRPRRSDEDSASYRFLPNTTEQKQNIVKQLSQGELLQFAIHPNTGYLYGTKYTDYSNTYNMLDVLSSEVSHFQTIGFLGCKIIMVVSEPIVWQDRFTSRQFTRDEAYKRINEGVASLSWGIDNQDTIHWVNNTHNLITSANDIICISKNQKYNKDAPAINVAQRLLTHLSSMSKYE